jgi:hypothetical protein
MRIPDFPVKLADSESFKLKELWRDVADFVTLLAIIKWASS